MFRLPVYEALIDDSDCGIWKISLVDDPAVESGFVYFSNDKRMISYSVQDEEKHLVTGVLMRADFPIYRNDNGFEYYIKYSKETIRIMAEKMMLDNTFNNVNLMHTDGTDVEGVNLCQLFIKDSAAGISPQGFEDIEEGSLFCTYKVDNQDIWKSIKQGLFKGFSLEGIFDMKRVEARKERKNSLYSSMSKLFNKFLKSFVKCGNVQTDKGEVYWVGEADLEIGDELFYDSKDGEIIKVEDGDYTLDDGTVITVKEGLVSAITKADGKSEGELDEFAKKKTGCEEETIVEEPAAEETIVEEPAEEPKDDKYDELKADIDDLRKEHDELKGMFEEMKNTLDAILNKPAAEPIVEEFNKVNRTPDTVIPKFGSKSRLNK